MAATMQIFMPKGGATEAYCNRAVCQSVSPSFTSISRRSLKTKRQNKQHKQNSIFTRIFCRSLVLKLRSRVMASDLLTVIAIAGNLDFSEDKTAHN